MAWPHSDELEGDFSKPGFNVQLGKMLQPEPSSAKDTLEPYIRAANVAWKGINLEDVKEMWFSPFEKKQYALQKGDLLVSEGGDVGRASLWKGELENCYIQNAINRVRSKGVHSTHFLYYWIYTLKHSGYIDMLCNKATIAHFTAEKVECVHVIYPPIEEQHAIADFLDRETAKLDTLIAKKRRLIELLGEQRAALISQAVTKGLNPDAPTKDSGVEWLGEIPAHWKISKVKYLTKVVSKGTTPTTMGAEFTYDGIRFIKAENIWDGLINDKPATFIDEATNALLQRSILQAEDVLIVIAGATTGKVGIVSEKHLPANTNQAVAFARPFKREISRFLFYWLSSTKIQEQVWLLAVQAAQPNLSLEDIRNFLVPTAPIKEMINIAAYLDWETAKIDALIGKTEETIGKLQEYRTALISAAVTGKIDVRQDVRSRK